MDIPYSVFDSPRALASKSSGGSATVRVFNSTTSVVVLLPDSKIAPERPVTDGWAARPPLLSIESLAPACTRECMTRDSEAVTRSCESREDFRDQLALHIARNLCLRDFPCQEVERHSKPEIESGTCPELLLPPVTVQCTASREKCLIEPSINATRVSFLFNWGAQSQGSVEEIMANSFFKFLGVKADQLPLLRRAPVDGYDVSFLITAALLQRYGMMNIVVSLVTFAWDTPQYLEKLKLNMEQQNTDLAQSVLRAFGKRAHGSA